MKKFKSTLSIFTAFVLMVSLLCTSVFAATTFDGDSVPNNNDSPVPNVEIEQNGLGGKSIDDPYYAVTAVSTSYQTGFYPLGGGNTLEVQFALSDASSVFVAYPRMYKESDKTAGNAVSYHRLEADSSGMRYYGGDYSSGLTTLLWSENVELVPGRWYTLVAKFQDDSASDGQRDQEFYINGELIHSGDGLTDYGYRNLAIGAKTAGHGVYIDNIIQSNNRGVSSNETHVLDISRLAASKLTAVGTGAEINEELASVMALEGVSVAQLKDGLVTKNIDDTVAVYNADLHSEASDDDEAIGKVIVIASKNGTEIEQAYNYYDVIELDYDEELGRGKNASDIVMNGGTSVASVAGNFGKAESDEVYKITSDKIHLAKTFNNGSATLGKSFCHLEFSFNIPEGAKIPMTLQYNTSVEQSNGTKYSYHPLNIEAGKITTGSGSNPTKVCDTNVKANQWHTFAVIIPSDGAEDGKSQLFIDGVCVKDDLSTPYGQGFRQPFISFSGISETAPAYIDNISAAKTTVYENAKHVISEVTSVGSVATIDEENASIVAEFGKTVGDVYDNIVTANNDDIVRIYNADYSALADNSDDTNDKIVVVASKNGTKLEQAYKYYELSEFDLDAEKGRGKYTSDLVLLSGTTAESISGNYGKLPTDEVYKVQRTTGDGISLANTFVDANLFSGNNYGRIDFDFAIDSGATASVRVAYYTESSHTSQQINFAVGQTTAGSGFVDPQPADIKANTWYSVTVTCPTAENDNDNEIKIYVNGKLLRKIGAKGALGMRRPFIIPYYTSTETFVYLDNISVSAGNSNDVENDVPARLDVNKGVAYNGAVSYIETPGASDFTTQNANTVIRFFDADWKLSDNVADAAYVVTAVKDSTGNECVWDYYTIDSEAKDYVVGAYYYGDNYLVRAYSKNADDKLYLATYDYIYDGNVLLGKKLTGIESEDFDSNNKAEIAGTKIDTVYRTMLWSENCAPYTNLGTLELKK